MKKVVKSAFVILYGVLILIIVLAVFSLILSGMETSLQTKILINKISSNIAMVLVPIATILVFVSMYSNLIKPIRDGSKKS